MKKVREIAERHGIDWREAGKLMCHDPDRLNEIYYEHSYKRMWKIASNRIITGPYVPRI